MRNVQQSKTTLFTHDLQKRKINLHTNNVCSGRHSSILHTEVVCMDPNHQLQAKNCHQTRSM